MKLQPKPDETLEQWIARATPAIMQAEGVDEEAARAKAKAQFEAAQGDQPGMDWDKNSWGEPITQGSDSADPPAGEQPPAPTGEQPTPITDVGDTSEFMGHLGTLGRMLLDRLIEAGIVPADQKPALLTALQEKFPDPAGGDPVAEDTEDPAPQPADQEGKPATPAAAKPPPSPSAETKPEGKEPPKKDPKVKGKKPAFLKGLEFVIDLRTEPEPTDPAADDLLQRWMGTKGFAGPVLLQHRYRGDGRDLSIKSLSEDRAGAYLCIWGAPFHGDLVNEFFTPATKGMLDIFHAVGKIPTLYHHAMDSTLKSMVIGLIDTMEPDDIGLWVESQIVKRQEYDKMIRPLVNKNMLAWSSGALPGGREVNKSTGEILYWPITEGSMTPTPMEWRMSLRWPIGHLKAAYDLAGLSHEALLKFMKTGSIDHDAQALALEQERIRILSLT